MNNKISLTGKFLLLGSITALSITSARATDRYWTGGAGGTGSSASMTSDSNWANNSDGSGTHTSPDNNDTAIFTATSVAAGTNITATLTGSEQFGEIQVLGSPTRTGTTLIESSSTSDHTLTLGGSGSSTLIEVDAGAGAVVIGDSSRGIDLETNSDDAGTTFSIVNNASLTIQNDFQMKLSSDGTSTLSITGSGTTTFNGTLDDDKDSQKMALSVGTGSIVNLTHSTGFTGATTVNGTLNVNASSALTNTSSISIVGGTLNVNAGSNSHHSIASTVTVTSGGTLAFNETNNAMSTSSHVSLSGSSLVMSGATQTIGTLTLVAGTSNTIDLSGKGTLTISDINWGNGATLTIVGWTGSTTAAGTNDTSIVLGSDARDAIDDHLDDISWTGATVNGTTSNYDSATIGRYNHQLLPGGSPVVPVPEPSTVFLGLGLLALLAWGGREKLLRSARRLACA